MVKIFTLTFLLALFLYLPGFGQAKNVVAGREDNPVRIVKFYPNPATANITFELPKGSSYTLQIYNFMGKKVFEVKNAAAVNLVNLTDFNRGIYIFQLLDNTGKIVESGKFQVSK